MKKSFIFTGVSLVALLVSGCNLLPLPVAHTGSSSDSKSSSVLSDSTGLTTADPTTNPTGTTIVPTTTVPSTSPTTGPSTGTTTGPTSSIPTSSTSTPTPGDYYAECEGLSGTALLDKLFEINQPKVKAYTWERDEAADEALDDPTSVLCIYTRHNIKKSNHVSSGYSWDKWNKEHIWPQGSWDSSRTDTHNYFACEGEINNQRSSKIFAEGGNRITVHNHVTDCYQTSSTFEPCDEAKGEVARSVMYGAVMYKNDRDLTDIIATVELALKWHIEHPNTERDIRRNEVVYASDQANRNPFVDHPEYACRIWGTTNSETRGLCGIN